MGLFIKYAFTPKHRAGPKHRYNVVALDGQDWQSAYPTDSPKHRADSEPWVDQCCEGFDSNEHSPDCPTL